MTAVAGSGRKPIFTNKDLVLLILPLVAEQALTLFVGMVDSLMVASIGETAVSGVNLVDNVMTLMILVFSAFGTGGAVVAGQYLGSERIEDAKRTGNQLVWFSAAVSIVIMAALYLCHNLILTRCFGGIGPDVDYHARRYMLIVMTSIPALAVYGAGTALFRTMGNATITMVLSLGMNVINVAFNALFIYILNMGTAGAAAATVIARFAAAVATVLLLCRKKYPIRLEGGFRWKPDGPLIARILRVGVPGGVENGMFQLGKLILIAMMAFYGESALAANAVGQTIATIQLIPGFALQLAVTTVIARCLGAGDIAQTKHYNRILMVIGYVSLTISCLLIWFAMPLLCRWYQLSDETARITWIMMLIHTIGSIVMWTPAFILPCSLRAAGDVTYAMVWSMISMWTFRVGLSLLFMLFTDLGAWSVWLAMMFDWVCRTAMYVLRWVRGSWQRKKVI